MTTNSGCPHGFPNPKNCFECMEEGGLPEEPWVKVGFPFKAKYEGICLGCQNVIDLGVLVQRWDLGDKATHYLHEPCNP